MKKAFTLIEILIVVSIIALLAAVGIPSFMNSRQGAEDQMKEVNIDTVNAAKDQWSILYNKPVGTSVDWDDIKDYIGGGIDEQSDLNIGGDSISINDIGTSASYQRRASITDRTAEVNAELSNGFLINAVCDCCSKRSITSSRGYPLINKTGTFGLI